MATRERQSDEELVKRAQRSASGDLRAFEALVERHQDRVRANCRYLSGSTADSEDLAQEVFIKAFYGLAGFEGRAEFWTWLQRIKVNHCINHLKKTKGPTFLDVDDPAVQAQTELHVESRAEKALDAKTERARIAQVLEALSDTLRIPLILRDMDGLAYQEIADELGIGLSAVKMRIKRGREEFRRLYQSAVESAEGRAPDREHETGAADG